MSTTVPYKAYLQPFAGANEVQFGAYPNTPYGQSEANAQSFADALGGLAGMTNRGDANGRTLASQYLGRLGTIGSSLTDDQYNNLRGAYGALYSQADFNGFDNVFKPNAVNQSRYVINDQGTFTTGAAEAETAKNEAAVAAGSMVKIPQGNSFVYLPTGSAAAQQMQAAGNKPNPNGVPGATPAATPAPTATTPQTSAAIPSTVLQPGNKGESVKQLQDFLVSQGLMTQEQVNTGYGIYGPQTTAAVAALQAKLKVDNSSGPGYFGPKTIAALTQAGAASGTTTQIGNSPPAGTSGTTTGTGVETGTDTSTKDVIDTYTQVYKQLGLGDIKTRWEAILKEQADTTNEMNDKIREVQSNPWLAQGIVDKEVQKVKDKYQGKLDTQTHLANLMDSLYKEGQDEVKFIVGHIETDKATAMAAAQKKQDAIDALSKDNEFRDIGGQQVLVNKATGKTVAVLGPSNKTTGTESERAASAVSNFSSTFVPGVKIDGNTPVIDSNGFITPYAWREAIKAAPSKGLDRATFIKQFGYLLYAENGKVSPSYGLTPQEEKLITG